jgi:hemoglobin/transferrin/lactoferrin receptor protein
LVIELYYPDRVNLEEQTPDKGEGIMVGQGREAHDCVFGRRLIICRFARLLGAVGLAAVALPQATVLAQSPSGSSEQTTVAQGGQEERLVYSVNRFPERPFDLARAVDVITSEDIWRRGARTLPEVLMEEVGIFVQQTNYGGGSPIIRGQIGKHILILVDGVQINNATYRFGPLQYLNTIDLQSVDRIEIVRGSPSVLGYAFGGLVNIITKKGPLSADAFGGSLYGRYSSADNAVIGHAEVSGRGSRYRYFGGLTYRSTDDVEAGGDAGVQPATGYDEGSGNLSLEYFATTERTLSLAYSYLEQDEVPRTDRVVGGNNLVFDFDPQRIEMVTVGYSDLTYRKWADSLQLRLSWIEQEEGRTEIRTSAPSTERRLWDAQTALGLDLEVAKLLGSHRLLYGVDLTTEDIDSTRTDRNLTTGATRERRGNYTDGASYDSYFVYVQDKFDLGDPLSVALGIRYGRFSAEGEESTSVGDLNLESDNDSLTAALSLVLHATESLNLVANVTRGYRAPNIDDLSVYDERSDGIEVPNQALKPEEAMTYELGLKLETDSVSGSASYYLSDLTELMVRSSGTFNGLPFFDLDGDGVQDPDELPVLQKQNVGEAKIWGYEFDGRWRASESFLVSGNYTWTKGDDESDDVPLSRIPPAFGTFAVRWSGQYTSRPWIELVLVHAGAQRRLSPADISDSRIGPEGTDGFDVLHLRGGLSLGSGARVSLALENITDELYKYHSSGVYRPGRQAVVQGELRF